MFVAAASPMSTAQGTDGEVCSQHNEGEGTVRYSALGFLRRGGVMLDSEGDLVNFEDPKLASFVIQAYDPTAESVESTDSEGEDRLITEGTSDDSFSWDGFSEVSTTEHFSLEDVVSEDEFDADAAPSLEVGEADEETFPMMAAINALLMDQLPNAGGDGNVTAETRSNPCSVKSPGNFLSKTTWGCSQGKCAFAERRSSAP